MNATNSTANTGNGKIIFPIVIHSMLRKGNVTSVAVFRAGLTGIENHKVIALRHDKLRAVLENTTA